MSIEAHQIIRSKRKTLAIIVKPDGSLVVRAPLRASEESIREFVHRSRPWIEKKQRELRTIVPVAPREYLPGESFMYLGHTYPLEIVREQVQSLILEENFKLAEIAQGNAQLVFDGWYRLQAREIINERVILYANQYAFEYKKVGITSARKRWGSCSANGSLNFSSRLIMAPLEAVDYVVVHELVHTLFHNHSKRFWDRVERILPDYQERRKWLRTNGHKLLF